MKWTLVRTIDSCKTKINKKLFSFVFYRSKEVFSSFLLLVSQLFFPLRNSRKEEKLENFEEKEKSFVFCRFFVGMSEEEKHFDFKFQISTKKFQIPDFDVCCCWRKTVKKRWNDANHRNNNSNNNFNINNQGLIKKILNFFLFNKSQFEYN